MMCGLPIITTSNYDTPFYFKDRINSLIANDPGAMIKAIKMLLSSDKMQEEISLAGRETAIKYFNIQTYINRWKNILI
jgi:glycosyltransferase involved in cell wall biosynthesis